MQFFYHLLFKIKQARVKRFTESVCGHMLYIFNYFSRVKAQGSDSLFIKEAVGMLDNWERVSDNIFKHKPSGVTIEIKMDDRIEAVTKKVLRIEIPNLVKTNSQLTIRLLSEISDVQIDDYFKNHMVLER